MAWRRPGEKPLSEPMMVKLPTHICVTRPLKNEFMFKISILWADISYDNDQQVSKIKHTTLREMGAVRKLDWSPCGMPRSTPHCHVSESVQQTGMESFDWLTIFTFKTRAKCPLNISQTFLLDKPFVTEIHNHISGR